MQGPAMDMLSSRSYLELSQEQEAEISINTLSRESRLRPRKGPAQPPEIPDKVTDRDSAAPDRPVRKRGRPRLEAKDATAIEVDRDRPYNINIVDQIHRNAVCRSDGHNAPIVSKRRLPSGLSDPASMY